MSCPVCRQEHRVGPQGAYGFARNNALANIIQKMREARKLPEPERKRALSGLLGRGFVIARVFEIFS